MSSFLSTLRNHRLMIFCIVLAIIVRILMWGFVTSFDLLPTGDEEGYYRRGESFARILSDVSSGYIPYPEAVTSAYGSGRWGPIHPLMMGAAIQLTQAQNDAENLAVERLLVSILSIGVMISIYMLASYLFNDVVAAIASIIFIFHPEFVIASHRIMSEISFALFFLIAFYALIRCIDSKTIRRGLVWSILCGLGLGLAGLTRATALPFFALFPLWIGFSIRNRYGFLYALLIILVSLILTSPWTYWLYQEEGRIVPLSTSGTLNLYLYNNEFFDINYVYDLEPSAARDDAYDNLRAYAKQEKISIYAAGSELATKEILANPLLFIRRNIDRAFHFWAMDDSLIQSILRLRYPPTSNEIVFSLELIMLLAHTVTLAFILRGMALSDSRHKWIFILSVVTMMALSLISVSVPRMHFTSVLLLLPYAGYGIFQREGLSSNKRFSVYAGSILIFIISLFSILPYIHAQRPSAHYRTLLATVDNWLGVPTELSDDFQFISWKPDETGIVTITIETEGYEFAKEKQSIEWNPQEERRLRFSTTSYAPVEDLELRIQGTVNDEPYDVIIKPITPSAWKSWTASGIPDLEFQWDATG